MRCIFIWGLVFSWLVVPGHVQADTPWDCHTIEVGSPPVLDGADGARLYDADGDGDLDVSVGWEQSGHSRIYLNPGIGAAVRNPWSVIAAGNPSDVVGVEDAMMGDFDGDGLTDLVSACEGSTRKVFVHFSPQDPDDFRNGSAWETQSFSTSFMPSLKWMFSVAMDVNEDGAMDIVVGAKDTNGTVGQIGWLQAPTAIASRRDLDNWDYHRMGNVGWTMSLLTQDVDGDNDLDIVVTDREPEAGLRGVRWLENPGTSGNQTSTWTNHMIGGTSDEVMFMDLADITGDGKLDAVTAVKDGDDTHIIWFEQSNIETDSWIEHSLDGVEDIGTGKAVAVNDINRDGQLDFVFSCEHSSELSGLVWLEYENTVYDHSWIRHEISGTAGVKFDMNALIDLDGDGDLDIINTEENDDLGVIWYENPYEIPGDATGDGKVDEADAEALSDHWGDQDATWKMGDFNRDEVVDAVDASILAANWTGSDAASEATSDVPEPSALIVLLAGLFGLSWYRPRRNT
jgi:hypothetical protein